MKAQDSVNGQLELFATCSFIAFLTFVALTDIKQIKGGMNYLVKQLSGPDVPRRKIGLGVKPGETSATPYGRAK